ncbi:MAG: H-X9-DG-CTERM domain-containing protein, partial [Armatimonadota bacterium]
VYSWRTAILPYCKNLQIFQCPNAKFDVEFSGGMDLTPDAKQSAYAMNEVHSISGPPTPPCWVHSDSAIAYPSRCIWITEAEGWSSVTRPPENEHTGARPNSAAARRHNGGCNYCFVDGHVKWLKPEAAKCEPGECWWSAEGE